MLCLLLLIGLPASGKTTLAATLAHSIPTLDPTVRCHVVCYDELLVEWRAPREGAMGSWEGDGEGFKKGRARMVETVESLVRGLVEGGGEGKHLVIVDDNMYYRSMRWPFYRICRTYTQTYLQLHLATSLSLSLSRNALRPHSARVPDHTIHAMFTRLEPPGLDQWERDSSITIDPSSSSSSPSAIASLILQIWADTGPRQLHLWLQEREDADSRRRDRGRNDASMMHRLNLRLVEIAGRYVRAAEAPRRGEVGRWVAGVKKEVLEEARRGVARGDGVDVDEVVAEFEKRVGDVDRRIDQ